MKRIGSCFLVVLAAVALSGGSAWAWQTCALMTGTWVAGSPPYGGSVQITGTHYDVAGNATKVTCDTNAGDITGVCVGCWSPPHLDFVGGLFPMTAACAPLGPMIGSFSTPGPRGAEVQVVKNGLPKNACVFHGAVDYSDSSKASYWAAYTVRKFNSAGKPTIEKGSFTVNSYDGQIFIGKIMIKYP